MIKISNQGVEKMVVENVKLNQIWIAKNHLEAYEIVGFQNEFDWETGEMYPVFHMKNLITGYIFGIAENILKKRYELDLFGQRQERKKMSTRNF
jgi:hypothetical protein